MIITICIYSLHEWLSFSSYDIWPTKKDSSKKMFGSKWLLKKENKSMVFLYLIY